MPKWIEIEHPRVAVTAVVAESALNDHLADQGWSKVGDATGPDQSGRPKKAAASTASSTEKKG